MLERIRGIIRFITDIIAGASLLEKGIALVSPMIFGLGTWLINRSLVDSILMGLSVLIITLFVVVYIRTGKIIKIDREREEGIKTIPQTLIDQTKELENLSKLKSDDFGEEYRETFSFTINPQARELRNRLKCSLNDFGIKSPDEVDRKIWNKFCINLLHRFEQNDIEGAKEVGECFYKKHRSVRKVEKREN